jgi:arabinogalactan endo-1,4-beta-galactosidase
MLPYIVQQGGTFSQNGQTQPLQTILTEDGANMFRMRLFVNPDTNYSDTDGAIQTLSYDIALAQELKATGAKLELDLMYSDTWADPGAQTMPAAWSGATTMSALDSDVYNYTYSTLNSFASAGVMPNMVQIGNEITNGLLWPATNGGPNGEVYYSGANTTTSWQNCGSILESAISAVRASQTANNSGTVQIAIHVDGGNVSGHPQSFFNDLTNLAGVTNYDVMGVSFYPGDGGNTGSAQLSTLASNLTSLADTYTGKKIMVLETNSPWEGTAPSSEWPATPAGQEAEFSSVINTVADLPNNAGEGALYWYPEAIQVPDTYIYQGGAIAMFNNSWSALPIVSVLPEPTSTALLGVAAMLAIGRRQRPHHPAIEPPPIH